MESHVPVVGEIVERHLSPSCMTDGKGDVDKIKPTLFSVGSVTCHSMGEAIGEAYTVCKKS